MTECPRCGSENLEWIEIAGSVARPQGSIYDCKRCEKQFKEIDQSRTGAPGE